MKTTLLLTLACTLCLAPARLWGADPPDKGKGLSADAELLAAAAPPAITLPRATRKGEPAPLPKAPVAAAPGQRADARITIGKTTHSLRPNQVGSFGRIHVAARERIPIELTYPGGRPGDNYVIQAMDGGRINEKPGAPKIELGKDHKLRFTFEPNLEPGVYRITVRQKTDLKILEFWVGEPIKNMIRRMDGKEVAK